MYPSEIDDRPLEMHAAIQEKVGTPKSRTIDQDKMIKKVVYLVENSWTRTKFIKPSFRWPRG